MPARKLTSGQRWALICRMFATAISRLTESPGANYNHDRTPVTVESLGHVGYRVRCYVFADGILYSTERTFTFEDAYQTGGARVEHAILDASNMMEQKLRDAGL